MSLYLRLVARARQPELDSGCWLWEGKTDHGGYARFTVRHPCKPHPVRRMVHIVVWLLVELGEEVAFRTADLIEAYEALQLSGLELDHLCHTPECINPDHLELVTPVENCARRRRPTIH